MVLSMVFSDPAPAPEKANPNESVPLPPAPTPAKVMAQMVVLDSAVRSKPPEEVILESSAQARMPPVTELIATDPPREAAMALLPRPTATLRIPALASMVEASSASRVTSNVDPLVTSLLAMIASTVLLISLTLAAPATDNAPPNFSSARAPAPTPPRVKAQIVPVDDASISTCHADVMVDEEILERTSLLSTLTAKEPPSEAAAADVLPTAPETPTTRELATMDALSSAESFTGPATVSSLLSSLT